MKKMRKATQDSPWTLGELVTLAYDIAPNRATAVKLLGILLEGRSVRIKANSGG